MRGDIWTKFGVMIDEVMLRQGAPARPPPAANALRCRRTSAHACAGLGGLIFASWPSAVCGRRPCVSAAVLKGRTAHEQDYHAPSHVRSIKRLGALRIRLDDARGHLWYMLWYRLWPNSASGMEPAPRKTFCARPPRPSQMFVHSDLPLYLNAPPPSL